VPVFRTHPDLGRPDPLEQLVAPVIDRDPAAVESFVRAAAPAVLRVVQRILGAQHPEVADIVQESLFAAIEALNTFEGKCTVRHFVWRVAALTAMNARRRLRLREQITASDGDADRYASDEPSPLGRTLAARRRDAFRLLLDELPSAQSEVLALHCVLGFTVAETAQATGVPVNTVRSRLLAAKAALRERLQQDPELWELVQGVS
jgi:RNA polymerase sigma-70 factor (ECF subfamily)